MMFNYIISDRLSGISGLASHDWLASIYNEKGKAIRLGEKGVRFYCLEYQNIL